MSFLNFGSRYSKPLDPDRAGRRRYTFVGRIILVALIAVVSGLIGEAYSGIVYGFDYDDYLQGFRAGFTIGLISALIEVFYICSVRQSWIRRVSFIPGLVVRILVLTLIVRFALVGNELLTNYLQNEPLVIELDFNEQVRDTVFSMALVILFVTLSQFASLIGFRRFLNLVLGRYFRPVNEARIFMFVDLIGSSRLARRLGDVRFHEYLSEFFYTIDPAIVETDGEIVSYVGDAVIITWPLGNNPVRNSLCLVALKSMVKRLDKAAPRFDDQFGVAPRFRAALHGGDVVVGECGNSRKQITFLGDVVNTAARIEAISKEEGIDLLASGKIVDAVTPPIGIAFDQLGERTPKDADQPIMLYRVIL